MVLFNKDEKDVKVDFSNYNLKKGMTYTIRDVENYHSILKSGTLNEDLEIEFPMQVKRLANKTFNNFGVYVVEFKLKRESFFKRLFNWF